jgi:ABC-2 type transport system permease protein
MNTPSNAVPVSPPDSQAIAPTARPATRAFYWSVRRELWENRSIYLAPLAVAAMALLGSLIVGVFYCLDALHSERRDRSILFWKSLPVSDRTTVLSKAAIPLVILPLVIFGIIVALQWILFSLSILVLLATGAGAATFWKQLPLFQMQLVLLYGLTVIALWHAPL